MTIDEIQKDINSKLPNAVVIAQEEVYTIMDNVLKQFYGEFTPDMYERTYQLLSSCVKSSVRSSGNNAEADVYFDSGMLSYSTGAKPSGDAVIGAANIGMHGALGLHMEAGSTRLLPDSEAAVARYIMPILKDALIQAGIPVV